MYYNNSKTKYCAPNFKSFVDDILSDAFDFNADYKHKKKRSFRGPATNIVENDEAFIIELAVPGYQKENFSLTTEKDELTVSYKLPATEGNTHYKRREFAPKAFEKSFELNREINTEGISANFKEGILSITLPKNQEESKKAQNITVN